MDLKRRKSVMARSIKLGHCVCNPKSPCPCETFIKYNVCPCAGERMPARSGPVALTQYVSRAGCASKIGQADLLRILGKLPPVTDPNILLGTAAGDDAGVYRIPGPHCLVQTVDVFTPVVDDAYLFGQIAAANSLSDIYAMGGKPITALSIIGFPIEELDGEIMERMLRGGLDKLNEAGCALIGGHSINDEEIKLGFAITGLIDADKVVERGKARPGDVLVLTKPLGTGMVSFAAQIGRISADCLNEAGEWMAALNKDAAELMVAHGAHACTDVTGFGLMGHLVEMARGSGVTVEIDMSRLPVFAAVPDCIENEILSGAIERNQEYSMAWVQVEDEASEKNLPILYDPQTSGGLLVSLPESAADAYVQEMRGRGHCAVFIVGRVLETSGSRRAGTVSVIGARLENLIGERKGILMTERKKSTEKPVKAAAENVAKGAAKAAEASCCTPPPATESGAACCASGAASSPSMMSTLSIASTESQSATPQDTETERAFAAFMREANKPGLIDARGKRLMSLALSIARKCEPCLKIHMTKALEEGLTMDEINEAAWLAISFCGSPAMMFYKEVRGRLEQRES